LKTQLPAGKHREKEDFVKNMFRNLVTAGVLAVSLASSAALAQTPAPVIPVPSNIEVPAGNVLFLSGHAQGTQNYVCLPSAGAFAWTFLMPQATLFLDYKLGRDEIRQQIITHFLSSNPAEGGTPRATWQSSFETSAAWGKMAPNGSSTDPKFVATGAIPWLLLQAMGTQRGPNGGDLLAQTSYVQRLNTAGGVAPAAGCSQAENVGTLALVPYTADYLFYKAIQPK